MYLYSDVTFENIAGDNPGGGMTSLLSLEYSSISMSATSFKNIDTIGINNNTIIGTI